VISIVGSETLLGRDLREALSEAGIRNVQLVGAQDELAITEESGEPAVITPLDEERLQESNAIFCAGSAESTKKAYQLAGAGTGDAPTFIDLTYALEDLPAARLRAPVVQKAPIESNIHVLAHPASTAIALILGSMPGTIKHSVVQVFEPASERGKAGIHELQQQTTSLLSFRQMEKKVFDAQIGFAMLARYGEDAPEQLQTVEQRIERHLATLLAGSGKPTPMPSMRVTQAPVFHGYSFSLWVEFDGARPDLADLSDELEGADIDVRGADLDAPTNIGAAGQSGITAGLIEADRNHPRAVWIWAVADNFRLLVDNAIQVGKALSK
jgi:aspartate-semialdehyde dehydrogenase